MTEQYTIDNMSEDEFYEYRRNLIKETFTINDFLSCDITKNRLLNEFLFVFEKKCVPKIEDYYGGMLKELHGNFATPLYYDKDGDFSSELTGIIYQNLKKEYDISIFHDCPSLANPLIAQYEGIQKKRKDALKKKRNNCSGITTNKKFDWGTKTHK